MSDLTAEAWSLAAVAQLRGIEQRCADEDLFCVGYLIPQVELVEIKFSGQDAQASLWRDRLSDFVHGNSVADGLEANDVQTVENLIAQL
ncbi:hypothetical protein [Reinekea sp.]|jgi:hypothetical protein|uniref:hypothetical protein n=1 Tax=Reinekea sp. TaxID=1970455 RepID=UPI003988B729